MAESARNTGPVASTPFGLASFAFFDQLGGGRRTSSRFPGRIPYPNVPAPSTRCGPPPFP
jgi:hypothetical protein